MVGQNACDSPIEIMSPFATRNHDSQHLPVMNAIIAFRLGEALTIIGYWSIGLT